MAAVLGSGFKCGPHKPYSSLQHQHHHHHHHHHHCNIYNLGWSSLWNCLLILLLLVSICIALFGKNVIEHWSSLQNMTWPEKYWAFEICQALVNCPAGNPPSIRDSNKAKKRLPAKNPNWKSESVCCGWDVFWESWNNKRLGADVSNHWGGGAWAKATHATKVKGATGGPAWAATLPSPCS